MTRGVLKYLYAVITLCLVINIKVMAQRTDILLLKNGDHITGEVKKMEYGLLTYKTDDAIESAKLINMENEISDAGKCQCLDDHNHL